MPRCERHKDIPENAEMPPDMLLDHFLMCLGYGQQAETLARVQSMAAVGGQCLMADHRSIITSQAQYTHKLLAGISEAVERLDGAEYGEVLDIRDNLKALIS